MLPGRAAILDAAPTGARPSGLSGRPSREPSAARPSRGGALRALGVAVLATAVLLTGLLGAGGASAQTENADGSLTLWEAQMTAASYMTGGNTCVGFFGALSHGSLSPQTFSEGSNSWTAQLVCLQSSGELAISFTSGSTDPDDLVDSNLEFHVGSTKFSGLTDSTNTSGQTFQIPSSGLTFTAGTTYTLKFTRNKAPSAPTNLHAKGVSATQIDLSWFAPSKTGGTDITGYKIEVSNTGTGGWTDLVASQTATTYSHTVASGVTRYYRVSAINAAGTSAVSNVASATAEDTAPGVDFAQVTFVHSGGVVTLVFDESLDTSSTPDKSQFTVKVQENNRTVTAATVALRSVLVSVWPVVKPGETVTVSYTKPTGMGAMPLKDAAGGETASFTDFAVMNRLAATAPDAPGSLTATAVAGDGTKMDLTWTTPWHNGSDITKFQVRYEAGTSVSATTMWADIDGSGPTTTRHQVTGLTGDTEYTFEVRAVNGIGGGSEAAVTERTTDTTAPTLQSAHMEDETHLILQYDEVLRSGNAGEPGASAFTVEVEGVERPVRLTAARPDDMQFALRLQTAVRPGETITVTYVVPSSRRIQDAAGNEAAGFTDEAVDNRLPPTAPEAPGSLTATPVATDNTKMDLTWTTPWNNGDAITKFQVRHEAGTSVSASTTWDDIDGSGPTTTDHQVTGLTSGTEYTFEVRAVNGEGNGAEAAVTQTTTDTTAPTFVSASIPANNAHWMVLTYSETLSASVPDKSAFTVKVEGDNRAPAASARDSASTGILLTFDAAFRPGEKVTVSYTKPGSNPIKDEADNEADSLAETAVTNTLAATAPEALSTLVLVDVGVPGTANAYGDRFGLVWTIPWDNGSTITKFQYRYAEGTSVPPTTTWTDIPDSAPGEQNEDFYTVDGLDSGTQYTFEVRAVNGIGGGGEKAATDTTPAPDWRFTLHDSSNNNVTELTEGGDAATATVSITNNVRFGTEQTIQLKWGAAALSTSLIHGAGSASTITIETNQSSGSIEINAPERGGATTYQPNLTQALTATHGGSQIASIDLTFVDDEPVPTATISMAPASVNEGDNIGIEIDVTPAWLAPENVEFTVTDTDSALSGTVPTNVRFSSGQTKRTITLTAAANTTQNDGAHDVTFALQLNDDSPYTLGTAPAVTSVTITVRDDDTPPLAPANLRAQAGNTEATLRWEAPAASTPDHGQPVLHYESRVKVGTGSFGSWTTIPGSDADTTSHKFTGLTNGTEYTYEVRAENVAGDGAEAEVMVTPVVGVAVSFGAATLSVDEGGTGQATLTLATAPATGTTVTVPITATPGEGLGTGEYSGVPASVTFAAGDTSKSFTVSGVQDTLDEPDEVLTLSLGTLPSGYVPGTPAELAITVVDDDVAQLEFTLTDSNGNAVTELTEGGDSATATVSITNGVTFSTEQTVDLKHGGNPLWRGLVRGAGDATTITIAANQASGSLEVSAPQDLFGTATYQPSFTLALTATHGGTEIGSIDVAFVDDEAVPVATVSATATTVDEGDGIEVEVVLTPPTITVVVNLAVADPDSALGGTSPTAVVFSAGDTAKTVTLPTVENGTQNDGARQVTITLQTNADHEYTLGTPSSVTITVRDDDTPPSAPRNLAAQAGNTEATLRWNAPAAGTPDHGQPVLRYEYRVKVGGGSFGSWTTLPGSGANTTSHTFTGLANDTLHTYGLAAVNVAGRGAGAQVPVTPIEGVAVSFAAAALSVDEGDNAAVTVTLGEAPTASVTVPISDTPGAGLDSSEYSGVPSSVTFNAGQTSRSFTVATVDDTDDEPDRTLTLSLGALPDGYVPGAHEALTLTVADNDHPIVSASFGAAAESVAEGIPFDVTVSLSQAPAREVALPIRAARGANLAADEVDGVPSSLTFAADETSRSFTVTFADDALEEGNETLTLTFGTLPFRVNSAGEHPQLVLTATDDDGPPAAPDVTVQTGDGYAALSWLPVANDSPILRYEVRWKEEGGAFAAWVSAGTATSYRAEGLTNGKAHEFEVRAVNAHGNGEEVSAPGTPSARITRIPNAPQHLRVKATDSGRAELKWGKPANATDEVITHPHSTMSEIQGYRIEVCRTACDDETNWYALVPNTGKFEHRYTHQVLAPGVIRENRYRVQAININGKVGPWSNVATLDPTALENVYLQTPDDSTLWVRFKVRNPDGNALHVRYENTGPVDVRDGNTGTGTVGYAERRLTKKGDVTLVLSGLDAGSWYRVDLDFVNTFDSERMQSHRYGTAKQGHTPLTSPYAKDMLDAQVWRGGQWREAPDNELYLRMGGTGKYRVRLKPCGSIYNVRSVRIQAPAGRLRASPTDTDPSLFTNLNCEVEQDGWRTDENGNYLTMGQIYDMTNFQDRANDRIPIYAGTPNNWHEVTVTARALEDYPADTRVDALLSVPFAVVYNHEVSYGSDDTRSGPVSEGTGLVRILVDRPADATLPVPGGVTIGSANRVMSWDAVPGAWGYLVEWRYGPHYSNRANQDRSYVSATSVTLPLGGSGRGPITARVRAYSNSGVSAWSAELTWDSRSPTLSVLDTAVNEDDGSVGFLVTLSPAATGTVTVDYTTQDDGTAVAGTDYIATSGTLTFAPGEREKKTALVPIVDDDEEDSGETFRLVLSNPTGRDANNGAAALGDAEAVATILNSEAEAAELTGFTLVDAGTNADLMALADGATVRLGELLASSYGIRANLGPGAAPGSVRLELAGAKTVAYTDDAAPYSLYGDGGGRINGASLPAGSYTLTATSYANSGAQGDELGTLSVSFTAAPGALATTTPGPFEVAEGATAVATLAADGDGHRGDGDVVNPGAGRRAARTGKRSRSPRKGALSFAAAKDFEAPDDADGDGAYAVTVAMAAGEQTATVDLRVTLTNVNEAPVAKASATPETVREGVEVALDGSASADPDADDTLSYAWTQTEDGPRVTLSDANAARPTFTSPSDLEAETELDLHAAGDRRGRTLRRGRRDGDGDAGLGGVDRGRGRLSGGGRGRGVPADAGGQRVPRADGARDRLRDGRDAGRGRARERDVRGRFAGGGAARADGGRYGCRERQRRHRGAGGGRRLGARGRGDDGVGDGARRRRGGARDDVGGGRDGVVGGHAGGGVRERRARRRLGGPVLEPAGARGAARQVAVVRPLGAQAEARLRR